MVLHLPKELLGSIFSTSLSLKDVVRLGRAMCSHESTAMYSDALCSTVVDVDLKGNKLELLQWALGRRVKINEIKLFRMDAALSKLLEKNVHGVTARNLEGEEILTVEQKYLATKITFLDVGEHDLLHCARVSNLEQLVCVLSVSNVECMAAFIQNNSLLRSLRITAAVLSQKVLEQRSVKLLELCLETSSELSDAVLVQLLTRSPLLEMLVEHLCNLEWLMLRAEMLTMLPPSSCAKLQWLKIQGTCDVGDFLPAFVKHTPALKYLCLYNSRSAGTGALLTSLSKHCPALQSLIVERGVSVTTKNLLSLIRGCPKLTELAMPVGKAMTDEVLQALAQHSYYLQELHLHREAVVTEAALLQLVTSCKHLTKLQDNQSSSITKELQQKLVQACAALGRTLECVVYAPVVWLLAPCSTTE
jgi:hypothetical protein